jgi:hypothetical protein
MSGNCSFQPDQKLIRRTFAFVSLWPVSVKMPIDFSYSFVNNTFETEGGSPFFYHLLNGNLPSYNWLLFVKMSMSLLNCASIGPFVQPPAYIWANMEQRWTDIGREKSKDSEKTCPRATFSTTNPTWTDPDPNPGLSCEKPATNRLRYGTNSLSHTAQVGLQRGNNFHRNINAKAVAWLTCPLRANTNGYVAIKTLLPQWKILFYCNL